MEAGLLDKVDCSDDYFIPGDALFDEIEAFAELVAEAEREQCAKLCEEMARRHNDIRRAALEVAAEWIRARGEP
jgi:hypothetical protein